MDLEMFNYLMVKKGQVVGHITADDADHAVTLKDRIDPDAVLVCFAYGQTPRLVEREIRLIEEKLRAA